MGMVISKQSCFVSIILVCLIIVVTPATSDVNETVIITPRFVPVADRTPEVRDAILAVTPNVTDAAKVTKTHVASITSLNLRNSGITELATGDFSGMTALTSLNLFGNQLSSLPAGIFEGLTKLTTVRFGRNAVDPLPFIVSLEKVADGQFKAVAPTGALFDIVLPISVTNGSITSGATTLTIPHGSVESDTLTATRTAGTTEDVTVDIGTLPNTPRTHYGYVLVKSDTLPLSIITGTNTVPIFTDGVSTTRSIAENTAASTNIGTPIVATDSENDTLTYTLSGTDAASFDIVSTTGQLQTKASLDYETKSSYTVTVTVSDGSLTGSITVTINITDVQEVGTPPITPDPPTTNVAPEFLEGDTTTRFVLENTAAGVNIGNPVYATDSPGDLLAYTLGGVDSDSFDVDSEGQLTTKAPLDYETKRIYSVTITVHDEELSDTITVIISVIDVNDTVFSVGFIPVADRTPAVRDAIVASIPNVTDAAKVTESQVATITSLNLRGKGIAQLKTGDFSGMSALTSLNLFRNNLSSLPSGIFNELTALTSLRLGGNVADPLPLIVSLQHVGNGQFKAVIATGAPFNVVLPINVTNGSIRGGANSVTIPKGSMESAIFTVVGTSPNVTIGTLPRLPPLHFGYTLAFSNVCSRTEAVVDAIANVIGVSDCSAVTEVDLATITTLDLSGQSITSLGSGDFDGMLSLRSLSLNDNDLTSLPDGIFDNLVSLGELFLNSNNLTTISNGTFSRLTSLTSLYLQSNDLSFLSADAFEGLSSLSVINLQDNELTSLPSSIFDGLPSLTDLFLSNNNLTSIPNGIFEGLTQLSQLHLSGNPTPAAQLSLTVTLQKVGTNQLKAVALSGAPFAMTIPITVSNGSLAGGANTILIPKGSVESIPMTVTRTAGTVAAVTADIGTPLPSRPSTHNGYAMVKSTTLPLEVLPPLNSPPVFKDGGNTVRTIAENTAAGTNIGDPVSATDQDVDDTLTYTLGGTDAASFAVDNKTGQLKTKAALDYETKSSYAVTLTVSDGLATDTITITINIADIDENRAPVFTEGSSTTRTVAENTSAGTNIGNAITATDPDNDTITYTLDGQDAKAFGIDTDTGQLKTSAALDYETKAVYSVSVTVTDGKRTATIAVTINVTVVEEAIEKPPVVNDGSSNNPPVFTDGSTTTRNVSEDAAIGVDIGVAVAATDADGHTLTYTLGGTDAASFSIDSTTGQLRTNAVLDYETKSSYTVTITASDGTDESTITITIRVVDATDNRAPVFTAGSSTTRSVSEDTGSGVDIGSPVSATDADGDSLTYTLGGTDANAFSIDSTNGQLRTDAFLDYENQSSHTVTITVSDGTLTDNISVTINVTDVAETPDNSSPEFDEGSSATRAVNENTGSGADIGSAVSATDTDGDTLSYSLSGNDAASFSIDSGSGQIRTNSSLDYETKDSYSVTVNVSDGQGGSDSTSVTINITDVNESPEFLDGTETTRTIAENIVAGINIGTAVSATDPDDGDTLTYTLGGVDAATFDVDNNTGQIKTKSALDFETKATYSVTLTVSDGTLTDTIRVAINVTNLDETPSNNPPVFTEGDSTSRTVNENTAPSTPIGAPISAADADNNPLAYLLSGQDAASFGIDSTTGQLRTSAPLNFETKSIYSVIATVSDGSSTDTIRVTINVSDVNEAPVFANDNITRTIAESTDVNTNIGSAVTAIDPDSDDLTYTLSGTDASSFSIVNTSGQLRTSAALDYETQTSYSVTITVSDGTLTDSIDVTINVTDVDENRAPSFTDGDNTTRSVAENTGSGVDIGSAVSAADPDNDDLTYTLGGTDAASFSINSTNGQLRTSAALDYENKRSYSVTITVSDGALTDSINVTIDVTDVDENRAPSFTDGDNTTRSVAENTGSGVDIGSAVSATDPDNDDLTYTLGGTDAASFSINSTNGQLRTSAALDYENKRSYAVTITVSDGALTDSINVTVNVTNVNEAAPSFTDGSSTTRSVAENTASGQNIDSAVAATDGDTGDTLIYTLAGTDAASFSIVTTSGQLQTSAALDYETTTSYSVTITVSDGSLTDSITVTINVTDVNEAPSFTDGSSTTRSVAENTASGQNIGSAVAAMDVDSDTTLNYTLGGTDAASFSIVSTSGQLQTSAALDYETTTSYSVTITVSDGNLTDSITVTINVTDVDENTIDPALSDRTSQVRDAIVAAVPGVDSADDVTAAHLAAITRLELYRKEITSLKTGDFNGLTSLTYLDLYKNSISDISALKGLTSLETLYLHDNSISDISALKGLTSLRWLRLYNNSIGDMSPLSGLTSLTRLGLGNTSISDISFLSKLTSLTYLDLSDNSISNISTVSKLTSLTTLGLNDNSISDISAISKLTSLTGLGLANNSISDISAVSGLTSLTSTRLEGNSISDISAVSGLTSLTYLGLESNSISDISAVSGLTALTILYLSGNSISDISAVSGLTSLIGLYLDDNSISDISAVSGLTSLTQLNLEDNTISSISAVSGLTSLTSLLLSNNTISDISAVSELTSLTTLYLHYNSVSDVSAVSGLTSLTDLSLPGNPIANYAPLRTLKAANSEINININIDNNPPVFTDGDSTTRSIAENTASRTNIGDPISATDADENDYLTYSFADSRFGNADAASFGIDDTNGQLYVSEQLDYETKTSYTVIIDVSDPYDGLDRITVTINITDVEGAAPSVETPPNIPEKTDLLSNFPNPFNPETWIPYQLAKPAEVTLRIYDMRGVVVRKIALGHKAAGVYRSRSRAIHWDGRNSIGEKVATGVYFYTLKAGDFTATRKLLIRK